MQRLVFQQAIQIALRQRGVAQHLIHLGQIEHIDGDAIHILDRDIQLQCILVQVGGSLIFAALECALGALIEFGSLLLPALRVSST